MANSNVKLPTAGRPAPATTFLDQSGKPVALKSLRGRWVVLYFYPKDATPGCTTEACSFRDHHAELCKLGVEVIGISMDSVLSHQRFAQKQRLTFPLWSDPEGKACKAFGVYQQKSLYGRTFWGIVRTTFLIDPNGRIAKIFPHVKVDQHTAEVLEAIRGLKKA